MLIALAVLVGPVLLWAVGKSLLSSGSLSLDKDIRRLGAHPWFTRDPRERYGIRRDAAEVLSQSKSPRARRFAVKCLRRKPNLAVLDDCSDELFAGLIDSDPPTAQACAELLYKCLADGVELTMGGFISGVAMSSSCAERYLERIRRTYRSGISDSAVASVLMRAELLIKSFLHKQASNRNSL
jgi:hypothetical protein